MGDAERIKRVDSRRVPRQAWPRVTAPQMPTVPTDLRQGQQRPPQQEHPSLQPGQRAGRHGEVSHRGRDADSQMGSLGDKRMGAVHRWLKGLQSRLPPSGKSQGPGFGAVPSRAVCWLASPDGHVCSPRPRPAGEELEWGERPGPGARGGENHACAGAAESGGGAEEEKLSPHRRVRARYACGCGPRVAAPCQA
jgi:hypothetical protein